MKQTMKQTILELIIIFVAMFIVYWCARYEMIEWHEKTHKVQCIQYGGVVTEYVHGFKEGHTTCVNVTNEENYKMVMAQHESTYHEVVFYPWLFSLLSGILITLILRKKKGVNMNGN